MPATGSPPASTSTTTDGGAAVVAEASGAGDLLVVGRIVKAHGLSGEVVVELVTDRTERLDPGSELEIEGGGSLRVGARRRQHSQPGRPATQSLQSRWLVAFEGVATREDAEALRGAVLLARPVTGDDGTLWVHELVGAQVLDPEGRVLGTVESVESNPASDLLVLEGGALVPVHFVVAHDPGRSVTVDVPAGLLDDGSG